MKKAKFVLMLIVLMLGVYGTINASAEESGTCGDNLTWVLDDSGTLTISGTGDMGANPWSSSRGKITTVNINDGVTSIGEAAFFSCKNLTSVTIPASVTSIGKYAFYGCSALTNILIPDGVLNIGKYAFAYCSSLKSITIPDGVVSV